MKTPLRVVFDCNVYFQAFVSERGPAAALLAEAVSGSLALYVSEVVLGEVVDVLNRPHLAAKFRYDAQRVQAFADKLRQIATMIDNPPHVFEFPRDPDDAHYIDLAVAAKARLVVSRDEDLLSLRDTGTEAGRDLVARFPELTILTPPEALALVRNP